MKVEVVIGEEEWYYRDAGEGGLKAGVHMHLKYVICTGEIVTVKSTILCNLYLLIF